MGSGKSTIARALTEELASCGSVLHLQRDEILMKLAKEGESYSSCYYRIKGDPALKRQLQTLCKNAWTLLQQISFWWTRVKPISGPI
ncbi:hypothetical protein TNCT_547661 [Trichonephila clavata]|uniref:Uncharacterized protein n=1 Tax=Trichonephila clavata TaxID=2740835 RepID=A0A8X6L3G0_TRICU|nr:hypothetical protein TNCT_547661 [Trichonephila clavata]